MKTSTKAGIAVLALAGALTAGAALLPGEQPPSPPAAALARGPVSGVSGEVPGSAASVRETIDALTGRLRRLPGDDQAWASLGAAYVQQARITADPSSYPKAEQALARSIALNPGNFAALTGQAALAAGRHDFTEAVRLARLSAEANPHGPGAQAVLADAYTQLGRYDEAERAIDRMMGLRPGVASFTRAAYAAELRGDRAGARRMLERALGDAFSPDDIAYCHYALGELALHSGDLAGASEQYRLALRATPGFTPALAGTARAAAFGGRTAEALDLYATVVERLPLPQYVIEYAEVIRASGGDPSGQWTLLRAQRDLMTGAGVRDDLTWAEYEADHGSPAKAVSHARAEYARNPNLVAADALAWALHRDGRSEEALPYARKATATGWRNALLLHHRAEIERAVGLTGRAGRSAAEARRANPAFSPRLPALARFS
ncbi:tetratricopeptide repeat protein [Planobispora rosea]|uniref:tetratricopeptide repeat protein n=1 Tax=Planobispora rosea TaxID=35762 RepID=UPI0009FCE194|nr:tetratricopeptide repeat protein [Planobispora rosea]